MKIDEAELLRAVVEGGLKRGVSHHWGFREVSGRRVFVKACADQRRLPRLSNEWIWLSKIFPAAPDLVPQPIAFLTDVPGFSALLVTAAIDAPPATELDGILAASRLGNALRALHSLRSPFTEICLDGRAWRTWPHFVHDSMVEYVEEIRAHGCHMDESTAKELCQAAETFVERHLPASIGIVHGDPTFLNLVVRGERGCLVDFELAQVGDPLFDLATADLLAIRGDTRMWSAFIESYGLTATDGLSYPLWFYQLLRQVRLARGKVWIHGHAEGFQREMRGVAALLGRRVDAENSHS